MLYLWRWRSSLTSSVPSFCLLVCINWRTLLLSFLLERWHCTCCVIFIKWSANPTFHSTRSRFRFQLIDLSKFLGCCTCFNVSLSDVSIMVLCNCFVFPLRIDVSLGVLSRVADAEKDFFPLYLLYDCVSSNWRMRCDVEVTLDQGSWVHYQNDPFLNIVGTSAILRLGFANKTSNYDIFILSTSILFNFPHFLLVRLRFRRCDSCHVVKKDRRCTDIEASSVSVNNPSMTWSSNETCVIHQKVRRKSIHELLRRSTHAHFSSSFLDKKRQESNTK